MYYLHYCALVCANAMLVSGNISEADLDMVSVLEFHCHAGDLYGKISDFYCGYKYRYTFHISGLSEVTLYL